MRKLFLAALVLLAACGDDSTGPSYPSVAGSWTYNASNVSGSGVSCNIFGANLSLSQSGSTFSGSYSNANLLCVSGTETLLDVVASGDVVNGAVTETGSVSFDFDTSDFAHYGTVSGNSMTGSTAWRMDYGGQIGVVTLSGSWSASR